MMIIPNRHYAELKDSYLFYHTADLPGGGSFHRSVCVAEFTYNEDGSIGLIKKCEGVNIIE